LGDTGRVQEAAEGTSRTVSGAVDKGTYPSVLSHVGGRQAGYPILSRAAVASPAACCYELSPAS
jgi:hypothetical protein